MDWMVPRDKLNMHIVQGARVLKHGTIKKCMHFQLPLNFVPCFILD